MRTLILALLLIIPGGVMAQDRMDCAIKAARTITADQIILNCGLSEDETAAFRSYLEASAAREAEMLRRQIETQDMILKLVRTTDEFARMTRAGVTEDALITLARRVSADVQDPAQAFAELRKAVEIAAKVQQDARDNPSTDAFVAEVQRRVAALSAGSDFAGANDAAETALSLWEADQQARERRGIELLQLAYDQNILNGEIEAAAAKRVRIADLQAGGRAAYSALRDIANDYYRTGYNIGAPTDLRLAVHVSDAALTRDMRDFDRAEIVNDQGIYFQIMGLRSGGKDGVDLLQRSEQSFRTALATFTRDRYPLDWAKTQSNLGNTLQEQGDIAEDEAGLDLLARSVAAYRRALTVYTFIDYPRQWAVVQNNLGNTLHKQGARTPHKRGIELLQQSVLAHSGALLIMNSRAFPLQSAMIQNNLGNSLKEQALRTHGPVGREKLSKAIQVLRSALRTLTRDTYPAHWATTQSNLGDALAVLGDRTPGPDGLALIRQAVAAYRSALTIHTRDGQPVNWAKIQGNLAMTHWAVADRGDTAGPRPLLEAALAHVTAALSVFDAQHMPLNHLRMIEVRQAVQARLGAGP